MSAAVLLDTDVFSYLFKGDTRAPLYAAHVAGKAPHLAFASVAELYRWSVVGNWGPSRIDKLKKTLARYTVLESDDATAWLWARITSIKGRPIDQGDAWIAASALRHGMPLVTHNRKHFDGIPGLTVISEG